MKKIILVFLLLKSMLFAEDEVSNLKKFLSRDVVALNLAREICESTNFFASEEFAESCHIVGSIDYKNGKHESDFKITKKICDDREEIYGGFACLDTGEKYLKAKGVKQDLKKADEYFEKAVRFAKTACDKEYSMLNTNVGFFGRGILEGYYYGNSCVVMGIAYENGYAVIKDKNMALAYFEKACKLEEFQCTYVNSLKGVK